MGGNKARNKIRNLSYHSQNSNFFLRSEVLVSPLCTFSPSPPFRLHILTDPHKKRYLQYVHFYYEEKKLRWGGGEREEGRDNR